MTEVAPHQSTTGLSRLSCTFGRCRKTITMTSAAMPIGTLMRSTQRQPVMKRISEAPASRPPMSGPMTEEMPKTARK